MPYYTIITCQMRSALDIYVIWKGSFYCSPAFVARVHSPSHSHYIRPSIHYILSHENIPRFIIIILLDFARKRLVSIIIISGGSSTYPLLLLFSTLFHFRRSRSQNEDDDHYKGTARKPDKPCWAIDIIIIIRSTIFFRDPSRISMHTHF